MTRDGAETIGATLDSITSQSLMPRFIVVVDDGSTDRTNQIVSAVAKDFEDIYVIHTASKTRDIRRVPVLLNLGLKGARLIAHGGLPRYMLVSGDDNLLSHDYAKSIIERMDGDDSIAAASGSWLRVRGGAGRMPHGAGRFVRTRFMDEIGGLYPVAYGWEPWVLYKAVQMGLKVKNFSDVRYKHLRPYSPGNLFGWGRAMYSLGFPTVFVILRFCLNLVWTRRGTQSRKSAVKMLAGYLSAKINPERLKPYLIEDDSLKGFVRRSSAARLTRPPW